MGVWLYLETLCYADIGIPYQNMKYHVYSHINIIEPSK